MLFRSRNAFDVANNFESHQLGTGMTYNIIGKHSVYGTLYRNFDDSYKATGNGMTVGYKYAF